MPAGSSSTLVTCSAGLQTPRDRAERIDQLSSTRSLIDDAMVETVARCLNIDVEALVEPITDRRPPGRHTKAMAGLRQGRGC